MVGRSTDTEGRIRNVSPGLRFFLAATLCVVLMVLDHRSDYLSTLRVYAGAALYPLQLAIDAPARAVRWSEENLAMRGRLARDNEALRTAATRAGARLQRLEALEAENARLRGLLDARSRIPDRVVVGEILAVDMDPLRHRVVLNRGSRAGAYEGQALIDAHGVVGQVTRDRLWSSEALLITDPDHAVPVAIARNGLRSIAVGTGDTGRLSLPFLARNADVREGDLLVTSGLGGVFPAGYPVATVASVRDSSGDAFLEVAARPSADLDRLHEVLLVFRSDERDSDAVDAGDEPAPSAGTLTVGSDEAAPEAPRSPQ